MYKNFEDILMAQQPELYMSIKRKSVDELKLSVDVKHTSVLFGRILDFYLFWIKEKNGIL